MILLVLFFPTMLVTIYVGFDLPLGFLKVSGANLPFKEEIFLGLGLCIFILNIRRSVRRWMGVNIVSKTAKFKWTSTVAKSRKTRVITYLILETCVMTFVGIALYKVSNYAWAPSLAFLIAAFDNLIFSVLGGVTNLYKVGLSSKALIVADRDVILLYFTGLRKVSIHQQSVYFDYVKGLQLSFPSDCIPEDKKPEFFKILEENIDSEKVFFSKTK